LLTERLPRSITRGCHRTALYLELVTGQPAAPVAPRLPVPAELITQWRRLLGHERRYVAVFPGGNASSRRWDRTRFRATVHETAAAGHDVVVLGGPAERELTRFVAGDVAFDAGGRTDLPMLAA